MGRIFLSYSREDRGCAERLAQVLEDEGHDVWWDKRLDGGEEFSDEIEAALAQAEVVLVAWSKTSAKSRWVRDEATVAGDSGRLIPISIDGSPPPMGFRQFHTLDLAGWKNGKGDTRTGDLLHTIDRRLRGRPAHAKTEPVSRHAARGRLLTLGVSAVGAVLALLVLLGVGYFLSGGKNEAPEGPRLTVALLRFTTTSADSRLRDIAAQATDSLSHTLPQSGVAVRLLEAPTNDSRQSSDFVISGEFSRKGERIIATVRMDQVAHGVTVFTRQFEAAADEANDLPERVGAQIAGTIAWAAPLIELEISHPSDTSIMADLLRQLDLLGDPLQAYQAAQRAAGRDPKSAFAQVALAFATAYNLGQLPQSEREHAVAEARRAAQRAVKLAPEFGDAYSVTCYLRSETLLRDCEDRLRRARRIDPDTPFADAYLSALLRSVGRFEEAHQLAKLSFARDPYAPTKIGWMLRSLQFNGQQAAAERLYEQGMRWWPEFSPDYFENRMLSLLERGEWQSIIRLEQNVATRQRPSGYGESGALHAAFELRSATAMASACRDDDDHWLRLRCLIGYASVGDLDGAFKVADKLYPKRIGRTPAETERIWLEAPNPTAPLELVTSPAAAPMRRDRRYIQLAQRVGLLAYWRSGRIPDFCRQNHEPICEQLVMRR
jgi:tetratricopeptide (TPR) repeat protein